MRSVRLHNVNARRLVVPTIATVVAALASYAWGWHYGRKAMDAYCGHVINATSAMAHAEALRLHMAVRSANEANDAAQAERILKVLVRGDVETIAQCQIDSACVKLFAGHAPDPTLLSAAQAIH